MRRWLRQHPLIYLWLPVGAWMGLIFYLSAQPDFPSPDSDVLQDLLGIGAHMFLFAVLAILWARALRSTARPVLLAFVLTLAYAFADEFHQMFVPGRTADPLDLVWDGLGAALGLGVWLLWQNWRTGRDQALPVAVDADRGQ